ncbi:MAG TPA: HAD family hydrolase [Longimicrobiales bacterium]|nr:HAD family hydrolase [Longimicrobiales bacterium]
MRARLAVFDMVGTTIQSGDDVPTSFREALLSVGVTATDADIKGVRGRSKKDAIAELLTARDATKMADRSQVELVHRRFQEALRAAYRSGAEAIPGADRVFEALHRGRVAVVLNTGLDRDTAELLVDSVGWSALGLRGLVTGDDVERGRPAPDLIHAAMRLAGIENPGEVVAIGDTTADLDAAAAAHVGWSVGVLTGAHARIRLESHPHSVILNTVDELPEWLAEVGAI